jgi:hypothetical protein
MIEIDSFLEIGSQHRICEDYIIQGNDPTQYIILADGCSSANNTEMGARILSHLAKQYLKYRGDDNLYDIAYKDLGSWVIYNAELIARQMGLSLSCLTSTLIVAFVRDGWIKVYMYGDGCMITQTPKYDSIEITKVDFTGNAPYYLVYQIDKERGEIYHENKPEKIVSVDFSKETDSCLSRKRSYAYDFPGEYEFKMSVHPLVMIASDGMFSFLMNKGASDLVNPMNLLKDGFISFKNTKGAFLQRRLNKYMKQLNQQGITHFDDLSVGAFLQV